MQSEAPEAPPRLEVVGPARPEEDAPAARSASGDARVSRRAIRWIAALLIVAVAALVVQTRRVGELGGRVEALGAELATAREELAAYEGQLGRVRGLVDDLGARLEELRELLDRDLRAADAPEEAL